MSELCNIIKAKDTRTAVKWCENLKIPMLVIGKKRVAYRFLVEVELDKRIIQLLKKQFPEEWEKIYRLYLENDRYGYILTSEERVEKKGKHNIFPTGSSKDALDFANE